MGQEKNITNNEDKIENENYRYSENILTPATVSGVVVSNFDVEGNEGDFEYKLVSDNGEEYFLIANSRWQNTLSMYCEHEVNIVGLLNATNNTLIPQEIIPKGPGGGSLIGIAADKGRDFIRQFIRGMNDWVRVPTALFIAV